MKIFSTLAYVFVLSALLLSCNSEPVTLSDHDWMVTDLAGSAATDDKLANLTLVFEEDQEIGGFAGCNDFRGAATFNQEQIKFSTLYSDNASCEDINLEKRYLSNLESSTSYTYSAGTLVLYDEDGNIVVEMEKSE